MNRHSIHPLWRALVGVSLITFGAALVWAILTLPPEPVGLTEAVQARLDASGVESAVTAVLLNFRSYDTLLEIAVLFLALLTIWGLGEGPAGRTGGAESRFLTTIVSLLTPLMVLIGGYVLWAGSHLPGGAFQAGAVIAAAAVLLLLAGLPAIQLPDVLTRAGVVLGPILFIGVGLACVALGRNFLEYPQSWAATSIMLIEVGSAISIAVILAGVFAGSSTHLAKPDPDEEGP